MPEADRLLVENSDAIKYPKILPRCYRYFGPLLLIVVGVIGMQIDKSPCGLSGYIDSLDVRAPENCRVSQDHCILNLDLEVFLYGHDKPSAWIYVPEGWAMAWYPHPSYPNSMENLRIECKVENDCSAARFYGSKGRIIVRKAEPDSDPYMR